MAGGDDDEPSDKKISVCIRIRPKRGESERYDAKCVRRLEDSSTVVSVIDERLGQEPKTFTFDSVLDDDEGQEAFYNCAIAEPVNKALDCSDLTIVAYGQTGSGKTYTLLGGEEDVTTEARDTSDPSSLIHSCSGVYLRVMADLLQYKASCAQRQQHVVIALSVVEIYNDNIFDLLQSKVQVSFREVGEDLILVNQQIVTIETPDDVRRFFEIAYSNRAVAATNMNEESSRSHALFFIDVLQQQVTPMTPSPPNAIEVLNMNSGFIKDLGDRPLPFSVSPRSPSARPRPAVTRRSSSDVGPPITRSRITLMDLAGSERIKRSGVTGQALTEALFVNKSLSTLGHVINCLCSQSKHIPFRDSKMTRILRSSFLSARSKIVFVTNVSPTMASVSETMGSIRFAHRLQELRIPTTVLYQAELHAQEVEYLALLREVDEMSADLRIADAQFADVYGSVSRRKAATLGLAQYRQLVDKKKNASEIEMRKHFEAEVAAEVHELRNMRPLDKEEALLATLTKQSTEETLVQNRLEAELDAIEKDWQKADEELKPISTERSKLMSVVEESTKELSVVREVCGHLSDSVQQASRETHEVGDKQMERHYAVLQSEVKEMESLQDHLGAVPRHQLHAVTVSLEYLQSKLEFALYTRQQESNGAALAASAAEGSGWMTKIAQRDAGEEGNPLGPLFYTGEQYVAASPSSVSLQHSPRLNQTSSPVDGSLEPGPVPIPTTFVDPLQTEKFMELDSSVRHSLESKMRRVLDRQELTDDLLLEIFRDLNRVAVSLSVVGDVVSAIESTDLLLTPAGMASLRVCLVDDLSPSSAVVLWARVVQGLTLYPKQPRLTGLGCRYAAARYTSILNSVESMEGSPATPALTSSATPPQVFNTIEFLEALMYDSGVATAADA